jgi:hypothetical protein
MLDEAKKCVLLCANCHYEVEDGLIDLEVLNVHPPGAYPVNGLKFELANHNCKR